MWGGWGRGSASPQCATSIVVAWAFAALDPSHPLIDLVPLLSLEIDRMQWCASAIRERPTGGAIAAWAQRRLGSE